MGFVKGETKTMTTTLITVLAQAHVILTRAEAGARIAPRMLARFAKKVRLAEKAAEAVPSGGATEAGLRAIVARAEAASTKRAPTAEQARALEDLRARLTRHDAGTDVSKLTESLRADTNALEAELNKPEKAKKPAPKKPAKRAKKKAR
jgi:hypothetical protein